MRPNIMFSFRNVNTEPCEGVVRTRPSDTSESPPSRPAFHPSEAVSKEAVVPSDNVHIHIGVPRETSTMFVDNNLDVLVRQGRRPFQLPDKADEPMLSLGVVSRERQARQT